MNLLSFLWCLLGNYGWNTEYLTVFPFFLIWLILPYFQRPLFVLRVLKSNFQHPLSCYINTLPLTNKTWEQNTHGRSYRDKVWSWEERMDHLETAIPRDPSHNQPPNANTIAYTSKILLKGPWYSCLLWGYARAWQTWNTFFQCKNWGLWVQMDKVAVWNHSGGKWV
jgi:hypothetical protein